MDCCGVKGIKHPRGGLFSCTCAPRVVLCTSRICAVLFSGGNPRQTLGGGGLRCWPHSMLLSARLKRVYTLPLHSSIVIPLFFFFPLTLLLLEKTSHLLTVLSLWNCSQKHKGSAPLQLQCHHLLFLLLLLLRILNGHFVTLPPPLPFSIHMQWGKEK